MKFQKNILNTSAKKLKNKKNLKLFKKIYKRYGEFNFLKGNLKAAIITPDKDIIPGFK